MYRQNRTPKKLVIIALILTLSAISAAHAAAEPVAYVDAPEYVLSNTFDVEIKIKDVYELDSGTFYLLFDPNVVGVTNVMAGDMGDMNVVFAEVDSNKIRGISIIKVLFNIRGVSGVSGSGSLATIRFEVTGSDGTCSVLNISNPNPLNPITYFEEGQLCNGSAGEITAKWENGIVRIGDPSSFDDPSDSGNSTDSNTSTPDAEVTIFVENHDDDDLWVTLSIDEAFEKKKKIPEDANVECCDRRRLAEGVHTFKIEWHDLDTGKDYEKTKKFSVSGETAITLMIDEHTEDDVDELIAHVHVKNMDDNDLDDVYLYIDGVYWKYKSISSGSMVEYGKHEFEEDEYALHSFRIEWFDPGTNETYEKIVRSYITTEEAVTLHVDRHTEEDIILLPDETPTPVSTRSTSTETTSRSVSDSQPSTRNTPSSNAFHTDPTLSENSAGYNGFGQGTTWYSLIGLITVLFALMQIRRS